MRAAPDEACKAFRFIALIWWRIAIICPRRPKVAAKSKRRVNLDWDRYAFSGRRCTDASGRGQRGFSALSARSAFFSSSSALPWTLGNSSLRPSRAAMIASATVSHATCLWSAGITYQGA